HCGEGLSTGQAFHGDHPEQRYAGSRGDRPTGVDYDPRAGEFIFGASGSKRGIDDTAEATQAELGVARNRRDGVPAAEVELTEHHLMTIPNLGHRGDPLPNRFAVQAGVAQLRADLAVQTDQVQPGLAQDTL